jgi:ClpP class serine protease
MRRRIVGSGEMLAVGPGVLQRDANTGAFFWLMGAGPAASERRGTHQDVAVVHVRGTLDHHRGTGDDSYEEILSRLQDAFAGRDQGEDGSPPSAVILCIDSRGGVVAGLNETVAAIQKLRKDAGIPLVAYVNEMAASAAFAIACSCDKRYGPASAVVGSIGTISTMASQYEKDRADGYDFRLLTSGARKADGHPHAPISDAAVNAEQRRVDALAQAFFKLASSALKVPASKLEAMQAAIFLGPEAARRGLLDGVRSLDDVAASLSREAPPSTEANGNETDRRASTNTALDKSAKLGSALPHATSLRGESRMKLKARIAAIAAALATGVDVAKNSALLAEKYGALAVAAEKGDDDPDDEGDDDDKDDDDPDESKSQKAAKKAEEAKKAAEAAKHRAKAAEFKKRAEEAEEAAKMAEGDDDDEAEEEEAKAALALVQQATGLTGRAALGAAASMFGAVQLQGKRLAAIEKRSEDEARASLIGSIAKASTKAERDMLATWPLAQVKSFVDVRLKSGLVHVDESSLVRPKHVEPGTAASLPRETLAMIDAATENYPGDKAKYRQSQIDAHLAAHKKNLDAALNGAGRI